MKSTLIILMSIIAFAECLPQAWTQQNSGTFESINAVWFCNPNTGFAAGSGGLILKTSNGGLNWNTVSSPCNITFHYIRMFGPDSIVAASKNNDTLLFTVNAGLNWTMREVETYYTTSADVNFITFNTGFYYKAGRIYCTDNAGQTWTQRNPGIGVRRMSFVNENTGWVCGLYTLPYPPPYGTNYSEVRVTYNAGVNWTILLSVQEASYSIYRIWMKNASEGFFNDASSYSIARTQNGGSSWNATSGAGTYQTYNEMCFPSYSTGYFIGYNTIKSTNGGLNWSTLSTPHPAQTYKGIYFINDLTGWLTGTGGTIIKTVTGGVTGINQGSAEPLSLKLYQNFPNPFNQVTVIRFELPRASNVDLKLFGVSGNGIMTIKKGFLSEGTYSVKLDASMIPSGIYFLRLKTDNGAKTIKIVLTK